MARKRPAHLLRDLEADRLRALAVVCAEVHVHDAPAEALRDLGAQPVHAVVVAAHAHHRRPVDRGPRQLGRLEVDGDEHHRAQAGGGRSRRHRVGEVPRGRAADGVEAELAGLAQCHRHQAVLEGKGGVAGGVVFDPEVPYAEGGAQAWRAEEGSEARALAHRRLAFEGQQLVVAPEVSRPRRDRFARQRAPHGGHVVHGLEGTPALAAGGRRLLGPLPPAFLAPEARHVAHLTSPLPERPSKRKAPRL